MGNPQAVKAAGALRLLPSTDDLLSSETARRLLPEVGRRRLTLFARAVIDELRQELIRSGSSNERLAEAYSKQTLRDDALLRVERLWEKMKSWFQGNF